VEADQQRLNHLLPKCLLGKKDKKVVEEVAGEEGVEVEGATGGAEEEEVVGVLEVGVLEVGVSEVVEEVEVASKVAGEIMVAGEVMVAEEAMGIHMVEEEGEDTEDTKIL